MNLTDFLNVSQRSSDFHSFLLFSLPLLPFSIKSENEKILLEILIRLKEYNAMQCNAMQSVQCNEIHQTCLFCQKPDRTNRTQKSSQTKLNGNLLTIQTHFKLGHLQIFVRSITTRRFG